MSKIADTPLMKQHKEIKEKYPDALLLFRVGDFYETFAEDAVKAASILGITLTKRQNGAAAHVELAGFPHHALDTYLPKLVRAGLRVAVCDQLEDPKLTKTLVKRGVTELVTPGVSTNDNVLAVGENNFLCAVHFDKNQVGISFLDISTGEFYLSQGSLEYAEKLFNSFAPKEVLYERKNRKLFEEALPTKIAKFEQDDWVYTIESARDRLFKQFEVNSFKGFGVEHLTCGITQTDIAYHQDIAYRRQPLCMARPFHYTQPRTARLAQR